MKLENPFVPGQHTRGHITYPGYEHLVMEVVVKTMEAERLFSFHWHPNAVDPKADYSKEPPTLVEFKLEKSPPGRCSSSPSRASTPCRPSGAPRPSAPTTAAGPSSSRTSRAMSTRRPSGAAAALRTSAPVFAALGDETRLTLLGKLSDGSARSISELTEGSP